MCYTASTSLVDLEELPEEPENAIDKLHKSVILMADAAVFLSIDAVHTVIATVVADSVTVVVCMTLSGDNYRCFTVGTSCT